MEHSKLPWKSRLDNYHQIYFIENEDEYILHTIRKDNAAFIVEACNNYEALKSERDELREALEKCVPALKFTIETIKATGMSNNYERNLLAEITVILAKQEAE